MNTNTSGRAIRLLGTIIRITRALLIALSVLVVILTALAVIGRGSMSVAATLDQQYTVDLGDGRAITVAEGSRSFLNFDIGAENDVDIDSVGLTVTVADSDMDTRITLAAMFVGWLAAAWMILIGVERLVAAAAAGDPFDAHSPRWLRRIGYGTLAGAAITLVGRVILESSLDTTVAIDLAIGGTPIWLLLAFSLGMFALAEVFGEAVRLREFEEATV